MNSITTLQTQPDMIQQTQTHIDKVQNSVIPILQQINMNHLACQETIKQYEQDTGNSPNIINKDDYFVIGDVFLEKKSTYISLGAIGINALVLGGNTLLSSVMQNPISGWISVVSTAITSGIVGMLYYKNYKDISLYCNKPLREYLIAIDEQQKAINTGNFSICEQRNKVLLSYELSFLFQSKDLAYSVATLITNKNIDEINKFLFKPDIVGNTSYAETFLSHLFYWVHYWKGLGVEGDILESKSLNCSINYTIIQFLNRIIPENSALHLKQMEWITMADLDEQSSSLLDKFQNKVGNVIDKLPSMVLRSATTGQEISIVDDLLQEYENLKSNNPNNHFPLFPILNKFRHKGDIQNDVNSLYKFKKEISLMKENQWMFSFKKNLKPLLETQEAVEGIYAIVTRHPDIVHLFPKLVIKENIAPMELSILLQDYYKSLLEIVMKYRG